MQITGTSYFPDRQSAISYYWSQSGDESKAGHDWAEKQVEQKIIEKSIHFGKPPVKPGQIVKLNLTEGRYFIQEN